MIKNQVKITNSELSPLVTRDETLKKEGLFSALPKLRRSMKSPSFQMSLARRKERGLG
jgi:hypothetical protein